MATGSPSRSTSPSRPRGPAAFSRIDLRAALKVRGSAAAATCALLLASCSAGPGEDEQGSDSGGEQTQAEGQTHDEDQDPQVTQDAGSPEPTAESTAEPEPTVEPEPEPELESEAELPGGGDALFPDRRLVALYGTPGVPELGALGEQDVEVAIDRITEKAEAYQEFSEEPVQPAFEIITTVASTEPGARGDFTNELDPETIRPWVEAAAEAEVYVVLDLQPGHRDFLAQAQEYEELLSEPHVGLALDPEWRLQDWQRHGHQVGSVTAEEVNATAGWLAELTAEEELPQKLFIIHQFTHAMIQDRENLDTSHDELAMTIHADGHGSPELKMSTWNELQRGLPEGIWMAWKNFHDEDTPTFTPEETYGLEPQPWFVSYQ